MKLVLVFLTIGLITCAQCVSKQDDKTEGDAKKPESSRRGRFFFLGNLLSGPAALASAGASSVGNSFLSLSRTLGSLGSSNDINTRPNVIYVARQCPLPLFTAGCPTGYVCATGTPGGTRCVPQSPDGTRCTTGFQCSSGVCQDNVCGRDECTLTQEGTSNCPNGQQCVLTSRGYRCQSQGPNRCPRPLSSVGCNRNQYCTTSSTGNICVEKQAVDATCSDPIECLSGTCRNNKCKEDACPMVDMSIDCMPTQYCSPGERGNMCVAKKESGSRCSSPHQCHSNVCERGVCVEDECPHPYMSARCLPSQFCSPAPSGNMCMEKRDTNGACHRDIECMSNTCVNRRCVTNQCSTPFSADGCSMMTQYCMPTTNGNQCVTRSNIGETCLVSTQCMSNNCVSGTCAAATPTLKANGAACASQSECSSTFCVLGNCAANQMSLGGMCVAATDCQSMTCTNMRCVDSAATTAATTTASSTSVTTTAATTAATTTASSLAVGSACSADSQCTSMRCLNLVCSEALLAIGEMCAANNECLSNLCSANACALGTVAMGAPCTNNFQCVSGLCAATQLCA